MIPGIVNIIEVLPMGEYRLRLFFDDGTKREVDFGPFLRASMHKDLRRWLDPEAFAAYRLEHGELVWGDYELCFPIADLYAGAIDHSPSLQAAV